MEKGADSAHMNERLTLEFDGGSRGNPGPAGVGVVIRAQDNTPVFTLGRCIGRATNNVAEYRALISALEKAIELGARRILIRGDSELIIKQMTGVYRVKHPDMKVLYDEAKALSRQFDEVKIRAQPAQQERIGRQTGESLAGSQAGCDGCGRRRVPSFAAG